MNEQLKTLFPLKGVVTQEILNKGERSNMQACVGAKTLREVLPKEYENRINWGNTVGNVDGLIITTENKAQMMYLTQPQEVTFIVVDVD